VREPDATFSDPRQAVLYDVFNNDRSDLEAYVTIADEVKAHRVVDVGCGTGSLAVRLAELGFSVTGVDPAGASLDVARAKPNAELVTWVHGDATSLVGLEAAADLAVMTGNVAQVFVSDEDWYATTLRAIRTCLRPGGWVRLRDPTIRGPGLGDLGPRAVPGRHARRPYGRRVMHRDRGRASPRDL
jgi:2-polyprenyl-3-methyl-5-hydroxy-6-metoxy-1,4-benzoquinol methylase